MKIDDSLRTVLLNRRTIRKFTGRKLSYEKINSLIWAACGHTHMHKKIKMRTAPSAGACYPVELYFVIENTEKTDDAIYYYDFVSEGMTEHKAGNFLLEIKRAALDQEFIPKANLVAIMVYNPDKIVPDYGHEARKYAILECGHIGQNILLMATSLGLGAVPVGAFYEKELETILEIARNKEVIYMVCVGAIE